jgi:hypothetical protein
MEDGSLFVFQTAYNSRILAHQKSRIGGINGCRLKSFSVLKLQKLIFSDLSA